MKLLEADNSIKQIKIYLGDAKHLSQNKEKMCPNCDGFGFFGEGIPGYGEDAVYGRARCNYCKGTGGVSPERFYEHIGKYYHRLSGNALSEFIQKNIKE